jgi:hypothetical protein
MSISAKYAGLLLTGTLIAGFYGNAALAADIDMGPLPAVSAVNGKIELGAGYADLDAYDGDGVFFGAATLSVPVGDMFGLQADFAVAHQFDETGVGGTLHFFTRDPNSYLLGVIGGFADFGSADALYVGPEAELYLDSVSIELAGGYMNLDAGSSSDELFLFADVGFYATENFRITVGASSVAAFETAHAGFEWLMGDMGLPMSLKGDVRIGEDDYLEATGSLNIYFGGSDKSLIRRHREDDPRNRSVDIFGSGALGAANGKGPGCAVFDPEVGFEEGVIYCREDEPI